MAADNALQILEIAAMIHDSRSRRPLPSLNVLVAEDGLANRVLAEGLLTRDGHRVTLAEDGACAVSRLLAAPYDVVLMDVDMPDIDAPLSHPLPSEDMNSVWRQYNEARDHGPVFGPGGDWNLSNFRERLIHKTVTTNREGRALLPVIHAPIRFRECRLEATGEGYEPRRETIRPADLGRLADGGRTVEIFPAREGDARSP